MKVTPEMRELMDAYAQQRYGARLDASEEFELHELSEDAERRLLAEAERRGCPVEEIVLELLRRTRA